MSGHSDTTRCPICNEEANYYIDWKPRNYEMTECLNCGFFEELLPKAQRLTLDEVNAQRQDQELEPITQEQYEKYTKDYNEYTEN